MPTPNVILDSCSYFRLAQSIRPLLKKEFGKEKYCLGVIKELDEEYEKNPALKHKFFWVNQRTLKGYFQKIRRGRTFTSLNEFLNESRSKLAKI